MNKSSADSSFSGTLQRFCQELSRMTHEDVSSVVTGLGELVRKKVTEDPYTAIATAVGLGFGLGALNRTFAKRAAIQVGKLVAMSAISKMDKQNNRAGGNPANSANVKGASNVANQLNQA